MYTLNNIVSLVEDWAAEHKQINSCRTGRRTDTEPEGEIIFPCLFFEIQSSSTTDNQESYKCSVFIADRVWADRSNEIEVLSDTKLIANDFLAYFRQTVFNNALTIVTETEMTPGYDREDESVYGWEIPVVFRQYLSLNLCQIPTT